MGYALRTERYRFIAWVDRGVASGAPFDAATVDAFELYDYQTDPLETENLVAHEDYAPVVNQLTQQLNSFFEKRPSPADAAFKTDKPKASTP